MNEPAINWKDDYYFSKSRIVYTHNELQIPGIRVFAMHLMSNALPALMPHFHDNCFEFTIISEGGFLFHCNNKKYAVSGGDVFISYPNEVHSTDKQPLSHGKIYWLQIDISSFPNLLFLDSDASRNLIEKLQHLDTHVIRIGNSTLLKLLQQAFHCVQIKQDSHLIASYVLLFLNLLIHYSCIPVDSLTSGIQETLLYIHDHLYDTITLEELADISHLSVSQFKTRFNKEIGYTPRNYINEQKINIAKNLLVKGYSKTEISNMLSFNTSSYFATVFKKYTTLTPSEYKKNCNCSEPT